MKTIAIIWFLIFDFEDFGLIFARKANENLNIWFSGDECESSDDDVYEVDEDGSEEDEESNEKFDNECHGAEDDDLSLSNRVIQFLQGFSTIHCFYSF